MLSDLERSQLYEWERRPSTPQGLALRARIVLRCAAGLSNKAVAAELGVAAQTVCKWRGRFVALRLDGLADAPRCGAPRTVDDALVAEIINKTLHERPRDATQWSTRAMSRESGVSQTTVCRIWRAHGLQPHRQETLKLS